MTGAAAPCAEGESVENDGQHVLADLQGRALRELDRVAIWDSALIVLGRGPAGALHGAPRVELRELELNAGLRDAALVKGWQDAERGQAQKYIECASVLNRAVDVPGSVQLVSLPLRLVGALQMRETRLRRGHEGVADTLNAIEARQRVFPAHRRVAVHHLHITMKGLPEGAKCA